MGTLVTLPRLQVPSPVLSSTQTCGWSSSSSWWWFTAESVHATSCYILDVIWILTGNTTGHYSFCDLGELLYYGKRPGFCNLTILSSSETSSFRVAPNSRVLYFTRQCENFSLRHSPSESSRSACVPVGSSTHFQCADTSTTVALEALSRRLGLL